jgi:pyrimidine deaminase RibD-like protein
MTSYLERALMQRAVALARQCVSEPGRISPKVGAVVTRDGVVLGEAFRGELAPGDHAEYTLLETKLADATLAGATLFTTLEPCTTRNSPKIPCAERIIDRRITRVVIGILDPNDAIRGRGALRLRDAGIEIAVFDPDLMAQIEEINRDFRRDQLGAQHLERTNVQTTDPDNLQRERQLVFALLTFLHGRRVLFDPWTLEEPKYVATSVLEVRARLDADLANLKPDAKAVESLWAIRAACLTYLTRVPHPEDAAGHWPGAINDLRDGVGNGIESLERDYKLTMPGGTGREQLTAINLPIPGTRPHTTGFSAQNSPTTSDKPAGQQGEPERDP